MHFSSLFIFLCLLLTAFYLVGLLSFLTDHEPGNNCEMTYMFEYPQYVRISQKIDEKYPKYGLYVYGEGRITKRARNMNFNGIPVLFIPGNAGSYKQVRSLASIALRKTLNSDTPYHFDYFTVDLNNELSALYGPLLYEQFDYVTHSIRKILELYKGISNPPDKVILVGHSVGGVIAKKAIALPNEKNDLISIIITLASPLKRNVLYFDRFSSKFYKNTQIGHDTVNIISIAGGFSDFLVPSYLNNLSGNNTLNLVTTNIPKSWVEANHVQILWCKQTVMALNRALFDSVDQKALRISSNVSFIQNIFRHHLIHNSGVKLHIQKQQNQMTKLDSKGEWIGDIRKQYSLDYKRGLKQLHWHMVSLTALPTYEILTVLAVGLETSNWIFACNAAYPRGPGRVCIDGEDLTPFSEIIPSSRYKRRLITINLHEIRKNNSEYTHVVFRAFPTSEPVKFHVDIYGASERRLEVSLPKISLTKQTVRTQTPENAVTFELIFPELVNVIQSYQLYVEPTRCSDEQQYATASLVVPWANEMVHTYLTENSQKSLILRLQNVKPLNATDARVRLILEPSCVYKISIKINFFGILSHLARYYSVFLLTHTAVTFLLVFQYQIYQLGKNGNFPIFFRSVFNIVKYSWLVIIGAGMLSKILSYPIWTKFLPQPDVISFPNNGDLIDLLLIPLLLHMVSVIIVLILVSAFCISLLSLESTAHKLILKFLAKTVTLTIRFSDYFMTFLQKVPFIVASILILLCFSTCGGLALCLGMIFYFLKLTKISQEYVEKITWFLLKTAGKKIKGLFCKKNTNQNEISVNVTNVRDNTAHVTSNQNNDDAREDNDDDIAKLGDANKKDKSDEVTKEEFCLTGTNNSLFFHSSMFFIWFIVMVLNLPAVLTWAHNFRFSRHLSRDESFLPGLLLSISAVPLWSFDFPSTNGKFTHELRLITLYFTIIILIYGTISVYVVNYLLTILFVLVVVQQYFNITQSASNDTDDSKHHEDNYDEVKMKLD